MKERIIKYFTDELEQDERIDLLRDMGQDDNLKKEYAFYRNARGLLSFVSHPDDKKYGDWKYHHFMALNKKKSKLKLYKQVLNYAAIAVLLIAGTWIISHFYYKESFEKVITYNTLTVPAGQRASITLGDGTEIWLNARSSIKYPSHFIGDMRKVELQGEAFFDVTSDKDKPFIVSTSSVDVKVLGTVFNVRENPLGTAVDVSLLEGTVDVSPAQNSSSKVKLKPMQNLHYENGVAKVSNITSENDFLWRKGVFNFDDHNLGDICDILKWYYDIEIIVHNPKIEECPCSGKFRQQDGPYEILRIIQKMHKFKIEKDDINNIIVLSL